MDNHNYYAPPEAELQSEEVARGATKGPVEFGDAIAEIFKFGGRHYLELFLISILLLAPFLILFALTGMLGAFQEELLVMGMAAALILGIPLGLMGFAGVIQHCHNLYQGGERSLDFGKMVKDGFFIGIFYLMFAVIYLIGLLMCIIPGIVVLTLFLPGPTIIVVEDKGPFEAFQRCWDLGWTHGQGWITFGMMFVMYVCSAIVSAGMMMVTVPLMVVFEGSIVLEMLVGFVPSLLMMPFSFAMFYIIYVTIVARTEATMYGYDDYDDGYGGDGGYGDGGANPYEQKPVYGAPGAGGDFGTGSTGSYGPDGDSGKSDQGWDKSPW